MNVLPLPLRIRAVSVKLAPNNDERYVDILVVSSDGSTIAIECENDATLGLQRAITRSASGRPQTILADAANPTGDAAADAQRNTSDVTERIKAQRESVESRRIFADLFDNSDAAIIDHDFSMLFRAVQQLKRNGVRNLRRYVDESSDRLDELIDVVRINNANAAALRMLGVPSLLQIDKQSTNIVDIAEAMFLGEASIKKSEYLVAGGTPIPVVYSLRIPKTEEEAKRVPIVIMDLSDVRLAEAAHQASIAKSRFLSSMSHEIRTPLNGVIGNLELLALTTLDNEQFELIDDADKAAKALLGLVGNILDFSKIEAGKLTIETGEINPAALVEEAVDVLQSRGRQRKIFIATTFDPDLPTIVRGDAMRIRQILLNLIGNAVKFTEEGGVQVSLSVVSWDQDVCELRFEVNDSGRGFDQRLAARLFEPFTQDRSGGDAAEGTGLGLSICKSLVEAFGGEIGCDAVLGEGATFWFTLPMAVVRRATPVPHADLSGVRVIVNGRGSDATTSLEAYFMSRGAAVVTEAHRSALAFAIGQGTAKTPTVDIAVLVSVGSDDDAAETARRLREKHIVPFRFGAGQPPRVWLRQGFAAIIPPDIATNHLDRNIRLLLGHTQIRDRLAAQQVAVVSAFAPIVGGTSVLVLEDRPINQTVIQKQLMKLGIECTLAFDGVKGLEALERQRFDLILCDCSMPVMDGYDFTRALRRREEAQQDGHRVPVIALTANAFREDADKCFEAGMDDFVSKPVTMDRLAGMLAKWLNPMATPSTAGWPRSDSPKGALPIDMAALTGILGSSEPEILNQVLAQFLATAGTSLADVEAAVSQGDYGLIRAAAHGAKGEARCAAANPLAEVYGELDTRAMEGNRVVSQALIARAAGELRRVEGFIRHRLLRGYA